MIEPNDDNLIRLLMTALITMASSFCTDKSDVHPMTTTIVSCSIQIIDDLANTDREINVIELREILTELINEYNDSLHSQVSTQSTTQKQGN